MYIFVRALDKREYLMIIFLISHQGGSDEGSRHMFLRIINKNIPNYHQILLLTRALVIMRLNNKKI